MTCTTRAPNCAAIRTSTTSLDQAVEASIPSNCPVTMGVEIGTRISQRVARNRRQHPGARGCGHFESPGLGKRKADADFRARFAASPTAGALLLDAEAVRRARDGVRRMKFNPKTGAPYIDPGTGEPYVEHEYSDMPLLRSSGITSRSTERSHQKGTCPSTSITALARSVRSNYRSAIKRRSRSD